MPSLAQVFSHAWVFSSFISCHEIISTLNSLLSLTQFNHAESTGNLIFNLYSAIEERPGRITVEPQANEASFRSKLSFKRYAGEMLDMQGKHPRKAEILRSFLVLNTHGGDDGDESPSAEEM